MLLPFSSGDVVLLPHKSCLWPARIVSMGPPLEAIFFQYSEVVLVGHHQLQAFTEERCEDVLQDCPKVRQKKLRMALKNARKYLQKREEEADGQNYLVKVAPKKQGGKINNTNGNTNGNTKQIENRLVPPLNLVDSDVLEKIVATEPEILLEACRVDSPLRISYTLAGIKSEALFRSKYLLVVSLEAMLRQMRDQSVGEGRKGERLREEITKGECQRKVRGILEADLLGAHDLVVSRVLFLCQEYLQVNGDAQLSQIISQFVYQSKSIIKQQLRDSTIFEKTVTIIN